MQPVCTTEIGRLALKYKELSAKGVKLATLSCDPVSAEYPSCTRSCSLLGKRQENMRGSPLIRGADRAYCAQVDSHTRWLNDVVAHCENNVRGTG